MMKERLKQIIAAEDGQGLTEYGLVLGLIAVAVVTTLVTLRTQIIALFQHAADTVKTGTTSMTSDSTSSAS